MMKPAVVGLFSKMLDFLFKRSKSGEKEQEIQEKKIDVFHKAIVNITYILIALIVLNAIFPSLLSLGDWNYNLTEKLINYMMGEIG